MHVVSLSGVRKAYDDTVLFDRVGFGLSTEDRVGVVGPNGSGKTTLLRIVAGAEPPDAGEVVPTAAARISYLPQAPRIDPHASALEVALDHPDRGVRRYEAEAMLDRLGIAPDAPLGALSGGQRRRVVVARALLPASDLLILDEPTNHLDVDTIDWIETELRRRASGLLLVTHDRYFLQRLTNRMLEIDPRADGASAPGQLFWHDGSYADLLEARAQRQTLRARAEQRRQNLLRKEIAWLRRGARARTSKPKFRLEQAAALQAAAMDEEPVELNLGTGQRRLGSHVLDAQDVHVAFGAEEVLRGVDLAVGPGERVGIVGPNGSGKTTLLHALVGRLRPDRGVIRWGQTVELGLFEQEAQVPPLDRTVLDTILAVGTHLPLAGGRTLPAERLAERFGFDARLQQAAVARLSGGERRRLALLHLLLRAPNVLLLDEPTNDLDLDTLGRLEDHLDGFGGTLIVASHDRYLLDRLTDRLYAVEGGELHGYLDWERYRDARLADRDSATDPDAPSPSAAHNRRRQQRRKQLRALEDRMDRLAADRDDLHQRLARAGADYEQAAALDQDLAATTASLADLEEQWLELSLDDPDA